MKSLLYISFIVLLMQVLFGACEKDDVRSPEELIPIPDEAFLEALIEKGMDTDGDGNISYGEAEFIFTLNLAGRDISSLSGIEGFVNLVRLGCRYNLLTTLDLSKNKQLEELDCHHNQLKLLNLTSNTRLRKLNCSWNELPILNLRHNRELEQLISGINPFSSLDLSKNTKLDFLTCSSSKLEQLDLSYNPLLTLLQCGSNPLRSLNVSGNDLIVFLDISDMPSLEDVCVWTLPFPPEGVGVNMEGSPNVHFTTDCQ